VDLPWDLGVAGGARRYEASPVVKYAEQNVPIYASVTPNAPSYGKLWGLHNTG
jgi:hypothetical protein